MNKCKKCEKKYNVEETIKHHGRHPWVGSFCSPFCYTRASSKKVSNIYSKASLFRFRDWFLKASDGILLEIADIVPLTTIDFPGKMAITIYVQGCNRHCVYCHNSHLISFKPGKIIWEDLVSNFLEPRLKNKWLDAVVFSGGEPTLQPGLFLAMKELKKRELSIGLHTNGDSLTPKIAVYCDYILLSQATDEKIEIAKWAKRLDLSTMENTEDGWKNKIERIK